MCDERSKAQIVDVLSTKLLEGWHLTGGACPVEACGTPLVAKQGRIFCIQCRLYCVRRRHFDPTKHAALGSPCAVQGDPAVVALQEGSSRAEGGGSAPLQPGLVELKAQLRHLSATQTPLFNFMNVNRSGLVTLRELRHGLAAAGLRSSPADTLALFEEVRNPGGRTSPHVPL